MSQLDRIKEEISWLKLFFTAFLALDASLIAWISQNHEQAESGLVLIAILAVILMSAVLFYICRSVYNRLAQLEDCE